MVRKGQHASHVSPEAETRHLAALQEAARAKLTDTNMQSAIGMALEDPSRSSPKFAAEAVEWVQRATAMPKNEAADEDWMQEQAVVTAAMIAIATATPSCVRAMKHGHAASSPRR